MRTGRLSNSANWLYRTMRHHSFSSRNVLQRSRPEHYRDRLDRDMRRMSVNIAASIDHDW